MTKFVISMIVIAAFIVSGLVGLLRGRRTPMASPEVLERVKQRNRDFEAQEERDDKS